METWREELYHYGVTGMKWGVLNEDSKSSTPIKKKTDILTELLSTSLNKIASLLKNKDMSKKTLADMKSQYISSRDPNNEYPEYKTVTEKTLKKYEADYCDAIACSSLVLKLLENHNVEDIAPDYYTIKWATSYRSTLANKELEWAEKELESTESLAEVNQLEKEKDIKAWSKHSFTEDNQKELVEKYPELKDFNFEPSIDEAESMYENANKPSINGKIIKEIQMPSISPIKAEKETVANLLSNETFETMKLKDVPEPSIIGKILPAIESFSKKAFSTASASIKIGKEKVASLLSKIKKVIK